MSGKRGFAKVTNLHDRIKQLKVRDVPSSSSKPAKEALVLREEMSSPPLLNSKREDGNSKSEYGNALAMKIIEPTNTNVDEVVT